MTWKWLPYGRQCIEPDDIDAVIAVLKSGYLTTGPVVEMFEKVLSERIGGTRAVSCSSGTAALHLAAIALDLRPDEKVVVPAMTFMATANMVRLTGAEIVFADVDPETGLMGPKELEQALSGVDLSKVRAVFPVHLNGQSADMTGIGEVATAKRLAVVEDAAHALGTVMYDASGAPGPVGNCRHSLMTIFSFHPVKVIAQGEGGAVTTNDAVLADRLRRLRSHGITREADDFADQEAARDERGAPNPWYHEMHELGLNYRASDIHCALGLSQLKKLDNFVARRRALAELYDTLFAGLAPVIRPVPRVPDCDPAWHLYAVLIDFEALGVDRADVMYRLEQQGIGSQVHYIPVHRQPYYRGRYGEFSLPGAEAYYSSVLSLPLFVGMEEEDLERVVAPLASLVNG
jgi:UDP-4-amino-4,6-dideoxy-N-acetyl-beta-L-altrosamine transaminase